MKTTQRANSDADALTIASDILAALCGLIVVAGLGYCFLFGFIPAFERSLVDEDYAAAIASVIASACYLVFWMRQQ